MGGAEWGEVGRRKSGGDGSRGRITGLACWTRFIIAPPPLFFFTRATDNYLLRCLGGKKKNACDSFFFSSGALESEGTGSRVNFPPPRRKRTASVVEGVRGVARKLFNAFFSLLLSSCAFPLAPIVHPHPTPPATPTPFPSSLQVFVSTGSSVSLCRHAR